MSRMPKQGLANTTTKKLNRLDTPLSAQTHAQAPSCIAGLWHSASTATGQLASLPHNGRKNKGELNGQ